MLFLMVSFAGCGEGVFSSTFQQKKEVGSLRTATDTKSDGTIEFGLVGGQNAIYPLEKLPYSSDPEKFQEIEMNGLMR